MGEYHFIELAPPLPRYNLQIRDKYPDNHGQFLKVSRFFTALLVFFFITISTDRRHLSII